MKVEPKDQKPQERKYTRAELQRRTQAADAAVKKCEQIILAYLSEAKDDPLGKDYFFRKRNTEWKAYVHQINKWFDLEVVRLDAFEKNLEKFMELSAAMSKKNEEAQSETNQEENPASSEEALEAQPTT